MIETRPLDVATPDPRLTSTVRDSRARKRGLPYRLLHSAKAMSSLLVLCVIILVAVFEPLLTPHDPSKQSLLLRLLPPAWEPTGDPRYILGTDQLGRDELSRIMGAARVSLSVGLITVLLSSLVGVALGLISGYARGSADRVITRLTDIQLAMPRILLAISVIAVMGPGVLSVIIALAVGGWPYQSRIVRAQVLALREKEFVEAARCIGVPTPRIILRHVFPHTLASVIIIATTSIATNIILESSLSFLGLGVEATTITWGGMLSDSRSYIRSNGWLSTLPGLAIMVTVLAVNLFGDWLRDELDPRLQTR